MNDRQTRNYEAGITGKTIMENFISLWTLKPPIVTKKGLLDSSLQKIEQLMDKQEQDNTGNATAKRNAKVKAANNAWIHSKVMAAYATDIDDETLRAEIDFEITDLLNIKDSKAKDRWQLIHDKANAHIAALTAGGYDISAATLLSLQNDIDAFVAIETTPRSTKVSSKSATTEMLKEFVNLKKIKVCLIELLAPYKDTNSEFYLSIVSAFSSVGIGVRHLAMRVTYLDDATNVRLKGVKSQIQDPIISKLSSERGIVDFSQQELPEANYTLISALDGYTDNTQVNVAVVKGKLLRLVIKLVKL